jgi:hypothetical protein
VRNSNIVKKSIVCDVYKSDNKGIFSKVNKASLNKEGTRTSKTAHYSDDEI